MSFSNQAPYWAAAAGAFLSYIVYSFVASLLERRRHARNAVKWGCKPPPQRPHSWPLGLDMVYRILKASKEKRVPDLFLELYEEMDHAATWWQRMLGNETILTVDPKNIQAILATQFQDFSIGEVRRGNFFPMLGNGIFLQDGRGW